MLVICRGKEMHVSQCSQNCSLNTCEYNCVNPIQYHEFADTAQDAYVWHPYAFC